MKPEIDKNLWQQAKAKTDFKSHLIAYVVVNLALWVVYFFTGGGYHHPWPVYPMAGWGIGLLFHYLDAYQYFQRDTEREYRKLTQGEQG